MISSDVLAYLRTHETRIRNELFDFLRIESVSTRPEKRADVARAAEWLAAALRAAGLETTVQATPGHPIVVGERRRAPGAPTVLVYGHYDVQPAEPLDEWTSPPFSPEIRDGRIYARGACDDKGQLFLHVKVLEALRSTRGELPVNVIVVAEGEEEVGSENLAPFVEKHAERLRADAVVISDSEMFAPGVPAIVSSLRGIAYFEIEARGPARDLHSGSYGGAVANPANALARVLASLQDGHGRVAIEGFNDRVRRWPDEALSAIARLPFDETAFRVETGSPPLDGASTLERLWTLPSCDVHGLLAGFTGEGSKTVIPARARAKVSFRLVADQDPAEIDRLVKAHVAQVAPPGVAVDVTLLHASPAWRADLDSDVFAAAARAVEFAFGRPPVAIGAGYSIPIVGEIERILRAPVLLLGFALPGDNAHAPDEWLSVDCFERGLVAIARLYEEIASAAVVD